MTQPVTIEIDGKEAGAVRAWLAITRAADNYAASLAHVDDAALANAKSAAEVDSIRRRGLSLLKQLETDEERYQRLIDETNDAQKRGALSAEQAGLALTRLNKLKFEASAAGKAAAQQERDAVQLGEQMAMNAENSRIARIRDVERAEKDRATLAQRVINEIQTPQARYNAQLRELSSLRKENRLTEEQYNAAVTKTRKEFEDTQSTSEGWLTSIGPKLAIAATGFVSVATAVGLVKTGISQVIESNRQFLADAEKAGAEYDKIFRNFRIQADLRGVQGKEAQSRILDIAERTGFTEERAGSAATALVSAGVSAQEASGGALEGFLNTLNAQGLRDSDPREFAESIAQYLNSQGMAVNTENMKMIGVQLQSLKETKMKLTDLPQLAQIGAGLKGKLTEQEQVATFATLGDTLGANIASTRMADIFKNLSVAGGKEDAVKELQKAGLKPTDIDFHGEDFATVMQRLSTALDKLKPEQQDILLAKVIEGGNISTFRLLQAELPEIMGRAASLNDVATYEADVAEGSSGIDATAARQALRRNRILAERNTNGTMLGNELVQQSLERQEAPIAQDVRKGSYDFLRYLGYGQGIDDNRAAAGAEFIGRGSADTSFLGGVGGFAAAPTNPFAIAQMLQQTLRVGKESAAEATKAQQGLMERQASALDQLVQFAQRKAGAGDRPDVQPPAPLNSQLNDDRNGRP